MHIFTMANAVMGKCIDNELLSGVMRFIRHHIMLVSGILMRTTKGASLADTSGSSCVFICIVGSNCVLLVPLHTSVAGMSSRGMHIFI